MAVVERDFFAVVDESGMLEAKFAFETSFICDVFPEGRGKGSHYVCGYLDQERHC